jgi:hypothetical protein
MSESSIQRLFKRFLSKAPEVAIKPKHKTHLLIDGSYFPNGLCLILYYDHDIRYVQLYRHTDQEIFSEIYEDLVNIKKLGVEVYSITCDGHKALLKAIKKTYPDVILILKAIPNMFHYLNDEQIPATTNRLENYFGHLKEKLTLHRGLRMQAKRNFIKWYLHFKNNPNKFF